ncbi:nuclear transport factor 2 family protein [Pseudoxanthobacter sp. M-2]|uniref:nuclear transport factor 2 family protein n=1 Tax=Pseudoxanthobacter sp. M-2 TaxID=3078754 RepID=UPI0038FBFEC6
MPTEPFFDRCRRRGVALCSIGPVAGLAVAMVLAVPAFAADADDAVKGWLDAVSSPDEAALAAVLAPEFQILRSDGRGYDRADYLGTGRSRQARPPVPRDLVVTASGDVLVVRYVLDVEQTIDGGTVVGEAPRLTVFRKEGDRWLVVAHANFAPIGK